jgi:hypothetical protein
MRLRWIVGELSRGRAALSVAALAAVVAGILLTFRVGLVPPSLEGRRYEVMTATVLALVDTPQSQAIDLGDSSGADVGLLSDRANLLAGLVTQAPMTQLIAARASVPARQLVAVPEKRLGKQIDEGPQVLAAATNPDDPRALVVRAKVPILPEGATPIIEITAQAPGRATAERIANATVTALQARVREVAASEDVPATRSVTVSRLSSPRVVAVAHGLSPFGAVLVSLLVFGAGCGAVLLASLLRSNWRRSAELERSPRSIPRPLRPPRLRSR